MTGQVTSQVTERWPRGDEWAAHPGEGGTAGRGVTVPPPIVGEAGAAGGVQRGPRG